MSLYRSERTCCTVPVPVREDLLCCPCTCQRGPVVPVPVREDLLYCTGQRGPVVLSLYLSERTCCPCTCQRGPVVLYRSERTCCTVPVPVREDLLYCPCTGQRGPVVLYRSERTCCTVPVPVREDLLYCPCTGQRGPVVLSLYLSERTCCPCTGQRGPVVLYRSERTCCVVPVPVREDLLCCPCTGQRGPVVMSLYRSERTCCTDRVCCFLSLASAHGMAPLAFRARYASCLPACEWGGSSDRCFTHRSNIRKLGSLRKRRG